MIHNTCTRLALCLIAAVAGSMPIMAQKPVRIELPGDGHTTFRYDAQGRMTEMISETTDPDDGSIDVSRNTWIYGTDRVEATDSYTLESTLRQTSVIENGRIVRDTILDLSNNYQTVRYYTYDEQNHLVSIRKMSPMYEKQVIFTWENGDIVKTEDFQDGNKQSETRYTPSSVAMVPEFSFGSPLARAIEEEAMNAAGPHAAGLFGVLPLHLIAHAEEESGHPEWDADNTYSIEYALRSNGRIDKIIVTDSEHSGMELKVIWDDDATDISTPATVATAESYISLQGVRSNTPHKGLNIVRHTDGSCSKKIF